MNKKRKRLHKIVRHLPKPVRSLRVPKVSLPGRRTAESDARLHAAIQNLPRITNETVAEHREEVLSSARKYIYPLSHSKRRVVSITTTLLIAAVVIFFAYCLTALYKFQSSSTFIYGVTQVIPFPVARIGTSFVSYESYLFELRHTEHYYQTQQKIDFSSTSGKQVRARLKHNAMEAVIQDAYVKKLAAQNKVSVSSQEVAEEVALVREQNRLGSSDQVFKDVLSEFWGWTTNDFERELKSQLLAQKVAAKLDTGADQHSQAALAQLKAGVDFATLAKQVSDDATTKINGGDYGIAIDKSNRDIAPQVVDELSRLHPGQYSDIINTGPWLEIDKLNSVEGTKFHASHIVFNIKPIADDVKPLHDKNAPHTYISVD
jgi:hypothetical protein